MQRFYADGFVRAYKYLERLQHKISYAEDWRTEVEHDLIMLKRECERIRFKFLAEKAQQIIDKARMPKLPFPPELDEANKHNSCCLAKGVE